MEQEERLATAEVVAKAAKRLDKVLCKYGKANGQVTKSNFNIVGRKNVFLLGSELSKVGTGYSSVGETIEEKVNSLVDAVEADLAATTKPVKEAKKTVEAPKEPATPAVEGTEGEEEVKITDVDADPTPKVDDGAAKKAKKAAAEKARRAKAKAAKAQK